MSSVWPTVILIIQFHLIRSLVRGDTMSILEHIQQRWYVVKEIDGVEYVIQDVYDESIEWVKLDEFASVWYFPTFAAAFSCCSSPDEIVLEVPVAGIPIKGK